MFITRDVVNCVLEGRIDKAYQAWYVSEKERMVRVVDEVVGWYLDCRTGESHRYLILNQETPLVQKLDEELGEASQDRSER